MILEETKYGRKSISGQILIIAVNILIVLIVILAYVSMNRSRTVLRYLMEDSILNIANSAATMVSGDDLKGMTGDYSDSKREEYGRMIDELEVFKNNTDLTYIYVVKKIGDNYCVVADPDFEGADEYGEVIETTPALLSAIKGTSSVDTDVDEDKWGVFYSGFSPVYAKDGSITGVIGVDFDAEWFDGRSASEDRMILILCMVAFGGSLALVLLLTKRARHEVLMHQIEGEKLLSVKRAIENANHAKSAFLEQITQETRNPIHTILDMGERIAQKTEVDRISVCASNIHTSGESLMRIINDVLDYSGIEAGKLRLEEKEYYAVKTLADIVGTIEPEMKKKGLSLVVNVDPELPRYLFGDPTHISQCLYNLLANALKYTDEGEVVLSVFVQSRNDKSAYIRFSVEDTGCGIRHEDLDRLFMPFEQLESGRSSGDTGTGLGLAIVTKLLEMMGSKLHVESLYGQGSLFTFVIMQDIVKEENVGDFETEYNMLYGQENK